MILVPSARELNLPIRRLLISISSKLPPPRSAATPLTSETPDIKPTAVKYASLSPEITSIVRLNFFLINSIKTFDLG